ncbi:hypothetical protein LOD99_15808 [Oopsacas minuta]|uniref:Uncharacterized protein n=1 Tax=Oopsacas minuta TaxID=111878 RepID=A0AAV7KB45_9METZ|nr:hypothetical protein LOD99_15808 [Oopsacas minuta]
MASWVPGPDGLSLVELPTEAEPLTTVTIFQQARDTIDTDINEIIECLNNKRKQLFEEITNLENEYTRKQQQTQKEIQKLTNLITHTEEALGENNLLEIQNKLIGDIRQEIEKINLEIEQEPNYNIEVKWKQYSKGIAFLIINDYVIEKVSQEAPSTGQGIIPLSDDQYFESTNSHDDLLVVSSPAFDLPSLTPGIELTPAIQPAIFYTLN